MFTSNILYFNYSHHYGNFAHKLYAYNWNIHSTFQKQMAYGIIFNLMHHNRIIFCILK